jgi:hypothetical protein
MEWSDKRLPRRVRREAGLRAERRASGAEMNMENRALSSGVERSDKKKKTR